MSNCPTTGVPSEFCTCVSCQKPDAAAVKERGILFSGAMVRALLRSENPKTQTRRICVPQPRAVGEIFATGNFRWLKILNHETGVFEDRPCPYGQVGEFLWVREAWRVGKGYDDAPGSAFTCPAVRYEANPELAAAGVTWGRYRHARFMPRWASRITLEVSDIRVERLQDISEADAIAEGIERIDDYRGTAWKSYEVIHSGRHRGQSHPHAVVPNAFPMISYRELWEAINGPGSWAANPWVWCVSFRRVMR